MKEELWTWTCTCGERSEQMRELSIAREAAREHDAVQHDGSMTAVLVSSSGIALA